MSKSILIGAGLGAAAGLIYALSRERSAEAATLPPPIVPPPSGGTKPTIPSPGGTMPKPPSTPLPGPTKPVFVPDAEGTEFFAQLSADPATRTRQLYEAVKRIKRTRGFDVPTADVVVKDTLGNTGVVTVTCDAVKLYGVRMNVDAYHAQLFADLFGAVMMTQKVADEMWKQAHFKLPTTTLGDFGETTGTMATTRAMLKASVKIDERLLAAGFDPRTDYNALVGNVGKDWLLSGWYWLPGMNSLHCKHQGMAGTVPNDETGVNYGFFSDTAAGGLFKPNGHGLYVIQNAANCHGYEHTDYSQNLRLIAGTMLVNGEAMPTATVLRSPDYAGLISYEGALPGARHPSVPLDHEGMYA